MKYKVTCLFMADWPLVSKAIFGDEHTVFMQTEGNVGLFVFDHHVTPVNIGPLAIIEQTDLERLFD